MVSYHDPNGSEKVVAILPNVQVQRIFGIVREYEIIVVENGLFFHVTTGAWRLGIRQGVPGGISGGLGGALPGGEGAFIGGLLYPTLKDYFESKGNADKRRINNSQQSNDNKYDFYINYNDIKNIVIGKMWNGLGGMTLHTMSGKIKCEFRPESIDEVIGALRVTVAHDIILVS